MIRLHLLTPCLAVGVCLAILVPMRGGDTAWDPDEQDTALFDQEAKTFSRPLAAAPVSPTLAKWKDAARPKARIRSLVLGKEPKGVRLASFETQLSVLEGCASPDNYAPIIASVQDGGKGTVCSTTKGAASNICSVVSPGAVGTCSTWTVASCSSGQEGVRDEPLSQPMQRQ